jgi:hypothetical protein
MNLEREMSEDIRKTLVQDLLAQPDEITTAERKLYNWKMDLIAAKDTYENRKCDLLLMLDADGNPVINGKNAEQREAQVRLRLIGEIGSIRACEEGLFAAERAYNYEVNTFRALRSVAGLIVGEKG